MKLRITISKYQLVVFMPNITTNHAVTCTNLLLRNDIFFPFCLPWRFLNFFMTLLSRPEWCHMRSLHTDVILFIYLFSFFSRAKTSAKQATNAWRAWRATRADKRRASLALPRLASRFPSLAWKTRKSNACYAGYLVLVSKPVRCLLNGAKKKWSLKSGKR